MILFTDTDKYVWCVKEEAEYSTGFIVTMYVVVFLLNPRGKALEKKAYKISLIFDFFLIFSTKCTEETLLRGLKNMFELWRFRVIELYFVLL